MKERAGEEEKMNTEFVTVFEKRALKTSKLSLSFKKCPKFRERERRGNN